jgi:hypothetical protein
MDLVDVAAIRDRGAQRDNGILTFPEPSLYWP